MAQVANTIQHHTTWWIVLAIVGSLKGAVNVTVHWKSRKCLGSQPANFYSTFTTDFSFRPPCQRVSQTITFLDKSKTSKQDKHVKFSTTASFLEAQLMDKWNPLDSLKTEESTRAVYVNGTAPALVYTKPCTYIPHLRAVFPTNPLTGITVANCGLQTVLPKTDTRNPLKKSDCFSKIYMYFACIHSIQIRWIRREALYHVHCSM